ncbi:MAG: secretin N-terminal domain-containing protein, partial [Planctomycetota bacterium]
MPSEPSIISKEPADRLQSIAIAEILRRIQALEAGIEAAPAPRPGPEIKPVAPKIEHPNEVSIEEVPAEIDQPNDVNKAAEPPRKAGPYEPQPLPNGGHVLKIQLPETLPMIDFLSFMGEHLGLDYLYDPAEVKGSNVTLRFQGRLRGEIRVEELYPLLESVMQFHGFVMTRKEGTSIVTIRKTDKIDTLSPYLFSGEGDKVEAGDLIITRVFELEHADPVSAQNLLTNMKLGAGVTPVPEAGTLAVTNYASNMARIEELLEMIDKPGEPKQFRFRQLKYTMATVVATKVEKLVQQLGEVSVTVARTAEKAPTPGRDSRRITRGQRPPRPPRQTPGQPQPAEAAVYLDFDERTNRILMIGRAEQLNVVEELVDALDVPQQDLRTLRVYEIQDVDAEEIRKKLGELGIIGRAEAAAQRPGRRSQPTRRATAKGEKPAAPPPPTTSTASGAEQPLVEEPQVIIIESINSLLVNATAEQHAQIAMIIGYVDNEAEIGTIPYVIYELENQNPEELAAVLNQLIQETTTRQEKDAKIITTTKKLEEDIIIIPDLKTYSLIVYASKKNQQWISSLIRQLDEYRPQVLLDCTLVEIVKNDQFNLAIDWIQAFPDLTEVSGKIPSLTEAVFPETRDRFIEFDASGSAFYGDEHINFLLTAVQTKNFGRVLARPKVLVNDNEIGIIKTEETQYIVRLESQISAGTTGTTSTTRSSVNFDSFNAGVTLEIEPHISKGDQLRLRVSLVRSDFRKTPPATVTDPDTGEARVIEKPPDTVTSDIQTTVTVPDGHTIILGGMEKLNQSKGGSKVPFLGDLPFIGVLFRSTQNEDTQARLYVFVRASIMRPGEVLDGDSTLEVVSGKNRATFEKYE